MIYHYTTLESLVLILNNQMMGSSGLDYVDDVEEGDVESANVYLARVGVQ